MSAQDTRWIQRFNHFTKALLQLQEAVALARQRPLSKLEEQGLIQSRNLTSHTYDEATAAQIVSAIRDTYFAEFEALRIKLDELKEEAGA